MSSNKENLVERIQNRLALSEAGKILTVMERASGSQIFHHMAAMQTAQLVSHYKTEAQAAIRQYRVWQYRDAIHSMQRPLHEQEGRHLLEAARAAATLYLDARRDYIDIISLATAEQQDEDAGGLEADSI